MPSTTTFKTPDYFKRGDRISAAFLNAVVDALVQRITVPGGLVTKVGQAVVIQMARGGGGGSSVGAFVGRVTARYGPFVTVSQVTGNVTNLIEVDPPRTVPYVWCQTAAHPWLAEAGDHVIVLPAPSGLFFNDPNAQPEEDPDTEETGSGEEEPPEAGKFPIRYIAVGTVPEADLRLYGGAEAECFFTPFDAGCTLESIAANDFPPKPE